MINKYKINFRQQLLLLMQPIGLYMLIVGIGVYYFKLTLNSLGFYVTLIIAFLFDTIPAFILHTNYLIVNWGALFIIDEEKKILTYKSVKIDTGIVSFSDINSLEYYVSYGRKTGVYSFARYRYYKIILRDGKEILITCLMINDIENTLEFQFQIKAKKIENFFCFVRKK